MAPSLRQETAREIISIVKKLEARASFRTILVEANSTGVIADHRTLRRYLDLLVQARVLKVRERDVGSVNPQQLYTAIDSKTHLWVGPVAMRLHGLNWDVPDNQLYQITTDLEAMVRGRSQTVQEKTRLVASLEDVLIHELKRDSEEETGTTELVAAMLATRTLDLPYLLRRADGLTIGRTTRLLFRKITETFTSLPGDAEGRTFLEARARFLKILRYYNSKGVLRLVETPGKRRHGLTAVQSLTPAQIVSATGKQLGISG
jgi:hypothetical protein